jgi:hypothetical protein
MGWMPSFCGLHEMWGSPTLEKQRGLTWATWLQNLSESQCIAGIAAHCELDGIDRRKYSLQNSPEILWNSVGS